MWIHGFFKNNTDKNSPMVQFGKRRETIRLFNSVELMVHTVKKS